MLRVNPCLWNLLLGMIFVGALQESSLPLTASSEGDLPSNCGLCYRRVFAGKKASETRVKRAFQCRAVQDCRRGCDGEKSFVCSGFNYRSGHGRRGRCELTALLYPRAGIDGDFREDPLCDYYERYIGCSARGPVQISEGLAHVPRSPPCPVDSSRADLGLRGTTNDLPLPPTVARESAHYPSNAEGPANLYLWPPRRRGFPPEGRRRVEAVDAQPASFPTGVLAQSYEDTDSADYGRPVYLGKSWSGYGSVYGGNSYGHRGRHIIGHPPEPETLPSKDPYDYGRSEGFATGDKEIHPRLGGWCSLKIGPGSRLAKAVLGATYLAANFEHCERLCIEEGRFLCASFSYRYDVTPTDPTDNCLLSDAPYGKLDFYTDTEPNRNDDVYTLIRDSKDCETERRKILARELPEECFWRLRSGFDLPPDVPRTALVAQDLGECQVACATQRAFLCKSFAYRHPSKAGARDLGPNCFLASRTCREMDQANMPDMDGTDLYERGKFGHGCGLPYAPYSAATGGEDSWKPEQGCYSGYRKPCKLAPTAISSSLRLNSESECRQKCSLMRRTGAVPCASLSYDDASAGTGDNCFLSDIPMRDLRPGIDYVHDDRQALYAWKVLDPWCQRSESIGDKRDTFPGVHPTLPGFFPEVHPLAVPGLSIGAGRPNEYANAIEGYRPPQDAGYELTYHDHPDASFRDPEFSPPDPFLTLQGYTVNGYPCKNGTVCQQNAIVGFWSCETEESENGEWDYCCEPRHRCGFSQGYRHPWCYVGPQEDQWRPCSEIYYPYLRSPRPSSGRSFAGQHTPDIRRTLYSARAWPILYLHRHPPPNCTNFPLRANTQRGP
ncbi:hypothetical protein KM043_000243 [Ampulex compressa]|nr:hypothetical protein KM043_000243 [Ampulex compressa]